MEMQSQISNLLSKTTTSWNKYWHDERTFPQWFQDGEELWNTSERDYEEFCSRMDGIYEVGDVLIYVEPNGTIHFSKLRGKGIDVEGLIALHKQLLERFECLYAWINKRDWRLKQIAERCGFTFSLVEKRQGESHGKVMAWQLYKSVV